MLLERVAKLLGFAASGAHPFCTQLPPQVQGGPHRGSVHAGAAPSGLQGHPNAGQAVSTGPAATPLPPLAIKEGLATTHGPDGPSRYHPQAGASSRTAWHAGRYGMAFGMAAPEEYVPHMMDQGRAHENEQGSLLGQS